ncbi:MAG: M20/M25/M40 family metallo-hydrolase [Isosphaeraceae bacterium]|nr:M20/M25/M40 family metallo-hydrolase [Isosphaeraceae bacterium]
MSGFRRCRLSPRFVVFRKKALVALVVVLGCRSASAGDLTPEEQRIVTAADAAATAALPLLERAVNIQSATMNLAGVRAVGALFRPQFERIGFTTRWAEMPAEMHRAGHLIAERTGTKGKRILLIGHLDTVLEGKPFRRNGSRAEGPGTVDMKGGDVIVLAALQALHDCGALDDRRIIVVFTGDEEQAGLPIERSRADLLDAARRSDIALAFEAAVDDTATVARRGVGSWWLTVGGAGGHSSGILQEPGAGAIYEAARILDAFRRELGGEKDLSLNPSLVLGGTEVEHDAERSRGSAEGKTNVIAGRTIVEGDLRFLSDDQKTRAHAKMSEIVARHLPRTSAEVVFADEYPAMAPKPANYELLDAFDRASRDLGMGPVRALEPTKRGAGDISFVASFVACLDGIGASGEHSHRADEYADVDSISTQIKRVALLLYRLTR